MVLWEIDAKCRKHKGHLLVFCCTVMRESRWKAVSFTDLPRSIGASRRWVWVNWDVDGKAKSKALLQLGARKVLFWTLVEVVVKSSLILQFSVPWLISLTWDPWVKGQTVLSLSSAVEKVFFFFIFLLTLFVLSCPVLLHYKLCSVNFGSTVWNTPLWKLHEPWSACRCLYRNRYIGGDLGRTVTA